VRGDVRVASITRHEPRSSESKDLLEARRSFCFSLLLSSRRLQLILGMRLLLALTGMAATAAFAQPRPTLGLNHFYLVPDSASFAAIESSRFLRDTLGVFEARTTRRSDQVYTGVYWYGRETYFEFLPPGAGGRKPGDSGLAWGSDSDRDTSLVRAALATVAGDSVTGVMITRGIDGTQVPWFQQTALRSAGSRTDLVTWVMNYAGDFLTRWNGSRPPTGGTSRAAVMERYAAVVNAHERRGAVPFENVIELRAAVSAKTREQLLAECRALGFVTTDSRCQTADGFVLDLELESPRVRGIRAITLRVRRPWTGPATRWFGTSALALDGSDRAVWSFGERR
jgi:hypothetical protein